MAPPTRIYQIAMPAVRLSEQHAQLAEQTEIRFDDFQPKTNAAPKILSQARITILVAQGLFLAHITNQLQNLFAMVQYIPESTVEVVTRRLHTLLLIDSYSTREMAKIKMQELHQFIKTTPLSVLYRIFDDYGQLDRAEYSFYDHFVLVTRGYEAPHRLRLDNGRAKVMPRELKETYQPPPLAAGPSMVDTGSNTDSLNAGAVCEQLQAFESNILQKMSSLTKPDVAEASTSTDPTAVSEVKEELVRMQEVLLSKMELMYNKGIHDGVDRLIHRFNAQSKTLNNNLSQSNRRANSFMKKFLRTAAGLMIDLNSQRLWKLHLDGETIKAKLVDVERAIAGEPPQEPEHVPPPDPVFPASPPGFRHEEPVVVDLSGDDEEDMEEDSENE